MISVVVVGFGPEPGLDQCLSSIHQQLSPEDELVLVDNGMTRPVEAAGVRIVDGGGNTGFAGGAVIGVTATSGDVLVFVNSDATLRPGALAALANALDDPEVGMVCGRVVLADQPDTVNAAGNPVHVTGLSWAGGLGDPVSAHDEVREVASVTGAFFAMRRAVWDRLGGLDPDFFMYYEDTDLSLRCWLAGLRVLVVPEAGATHDYAFARNPRTMFLLQRNRLTSVLTVFPRRLLFRAFPVVVPTEIALLAVAARDGWLLEDLAALAWVVSRPLYLTRRRRCVQRTVVAPRGADLLLTTTFSSPSLRPVPGQVLLERLLTRYWQLSGRGSRRIVPSTQLPLET